MIEILVSKISCGIHQLVGVSDATEEELALLLKGEIAISQRSSFDPPRIESLRSGSVYLFSDCVGIPSPGSIYQNRHGQKLSDMINEAGCGDLWEVGPFKNPNSVNKIKLWAWKYAKGRPKQPITPRFFKAKKIPKENQEEIADKAIKKIWLNSSRTARLKKS